ncbi:translation initiation factor IF-2-like [Cervus canadensis]|uniref:translation initiation factor IF-2-like n=1 Tax=Cervus canadensis TaxID=1574408 RepID=UPI001C9E7CFF|nr:translation initiation factor IF-2-like [Cervus canadensis]
MHPAFSSVLPKPSGHGKRLLSCESGSPRSLSSVRYPAPGRGREGLGGTQGKRAPRPPPRATARTPAGRASADRSPVPAARAAGSPEPSPPAPPQTGPTKEIQGRGAQRARPHARPFPVEEKLRCTRVQTRTRPARAGEGISYLSPRCYSSPPPPPTHGGLAAPRPEVGPPAARSERLHSLPGCARPAPAGPGGGGGGGDRDSGCSGGGGGGPSRRQSDWSREASSPVLVRRPGKPPGALLAGPPPPAAARPEPLGEPARRGSAARPAATCAEARGGGASGTPRRGVSRPPGRRPRPPVRPDSPRPRLDPLGRAAGAPRRIPGDVLPPHLEPEAGGPFPELEVWDRQIGLETAAPTKWLFPTCFWAPRVAVPCCLSLTCFARVKGVITPSRQRQSNWFAPAQADENRLTQSAQFWRSKIKVLADSDRLRPLDQQDAWLEDASFSLVFISR